MSKGNDSCQKGWIGSPQGKSVAYNKPKVKYNPIKIDWVTTISWSMLAVVYGAIVYSLIFG